MKKKLLKSGITALLFAAALPMTALAARGEWVQQNGNWMFKYSDGTYATEEWKQSGSGWFYLGQDGVMVTNGQQLLFRERERRPDQQ